MPLLTLQQPFATFRGRDSRIQGNVLYPAGGRMFSRSFVQPANPGSAAQATVRAALTAASQAFSDLSTAEVAAWQALADALPRTDPNGNEFSIGAKGMYVSVNAERILDGLAVDDVAPAAVTQAAATGITSLTDDTGPDVNDLIFTHGNADGFFIVEWTAPLPGTARQPRDNDFVLPSVDMADSIIAQAASPQTFSLADAANRLVLASGARVGVRITSLSPGYVKGQVFESVVTVA